MKATMSQDRSEQALELALKNTGDIGRGGASTAVNVDRSNPGGVSPTAVRHYVRDHIAEMTAPPAWVGPPDLVQVESTEDTARVRCTIWTEAGRSTLGIEFLVRWPRSDGDDTSWNYDWPSICIDQVVDTTTGQAVLTATDAPACDGPICCDPVAGTGEDPRIRRDAHIDDTILIGQICGRIEQALGHPHPNISVLPQSQQAIVALADGYHRTGEECTYTFIEDHPDLVHHMIWAARHIGAHPHAKYLEHALDVVASFAWNDPDREELGDTFDPLEDGIDINNVMITYIRANPDEFFR